MVRWQGCISAFVATVAAKVGADLRANGRGCWMERRMRGEDNGFVALCQHERAKSISWDLKSDSTWIQSQDQLNYPKTYKNPHCLLYVCSPLRSPLPSWIWALPVARVLDHSLWSVARWHLDQCHCSAFRFANPRHCWADQWCLQFEKTWPGLSYAFL